MRKKHGVAARRQVGLWIGETAPWPSEIARQRGARRSSVGLEQGREPWQTRASSARSAGSRKTSGTRTSRRLESLLARSCARPAARTAADDLHHYGGGLTPKLAELIERTYRGVNLLTYLKQEKLVGSDRKTLFDRAAEEARITQIKALGVDDESAES
ncbi:MAG: hypothetical protein OXB95_01375 [Rhodobacteraceae bacterium]|nr:hypothetical protein [Paracoccaceae bacterium]